MRRRALMGLVVLPWLVACGSEPPSSVVRAQPVADAPQESAPLDEEATGGPVAAADVQGDQDAIAACLAMRNYQDANLAAAFTTDAGTIRHWDGPGPDRMAEGHAYHVPAIIKGKPDDAIAYVCYIVDDRVEMSGPPGTPEIAGVIVIADGVNRGDTWLGIVKDTLVVERPTYNYERPPGDG